MEIGGNRSMNEFLDSKDQKEKKKKNVLVIMDEVGKSKEFFSLFFPSSISQSFAKME